MTGNLLSPPDHPKQGCGQLASTGSHLPAVTTYAELGRDIRTNETVKLGDLERRRGLYVLGRSGTGKTTLLVTLIEQDIKNGHEIFFLDPHGYGIEELKTRRNWYGREKDVLFFDPQDERLSFGINLLACPDISSINERAKTYDRAKGMFDKLWPNMFEDKPWLQKILHHAISVFIENQGYTLADMPLFFRSREFRDHLVRNVTHNKMVAEFWKDFATKSQRDQEREMEAAQSRAEMVVDVEFVNHIVGQAKTTVNFADIMEKRRIVLFKLPLTLSEETQKIIGTVIISELLHAVRNRAEVAADTLNQFCVFVDEIHKFASSRDFATLINEARKFGIATTYAHQERFGQFGDNKEMLGATDAAGTKVFFQTSQKGSVEQAGEFAKKPPVEIRFERDGVIASKPIAELLRARHRNQFIRDFTDCYLRPLEDKREDAREDMEEARIIATDLRNQEALARLEAQIEGTKGWQRDYGAMGKSLQNAAYYTSLARDETGRSLDLFATAKDKRLLFRRLDDLFIAIMEGKIKPERGNEEFCSFLAELARKFPKAVELYILADYGDPQIKRVIPFEFARKYSLSQESVAFHINEAEEKTRNARAEFRKGYLKKHWELFYYRHNDKAEEEEKKCTEKHAKELREIREGLVKCRPRRNRQEPMRTYALRVYARVVWLLCYPELMKLLMPYSRAKFTPWWKDVVRDLDKLIVQIVDVLDREIDESRWFLLRHECFLKRSVVRRVERFLRAYKEGAFVMLELLDAALWIFNFIHF